MIRKKYYMSSCINCLIENDQLERKYICDLSSKSNQRYLAYNKAIYVCMKSVDLN